MIVDALLAILCTILDWAYDLLPSWDISMNTLGGNEGWQIPAYGTVVGGNHTPLQMLLALCAKLNNFIPFDQLVVIISLSASLYLALLGYRFVKWVVGIFRGAGTN